MPGCAVLCVCGVNVMLQQLQSLSVRACQVLAGSIEFCKLVPYQSINQSIYLMSWGATGTQQTRSLVQ